MTPWGWRALGGLERRLAVEGAWRELDVIARMSQDELEVLAWAEMNDPEVDMAEIGEPVREEPLTVPDPVPRREPAPGPPSPAEPARPKEPVPA